MLYPIKDYQCYFFNIGSHFFLQFISISTLFYCQGGFPDSPIHGDGVTSREGSSSDTEGESFRGSSITMIKELETSSGSMIQNGGHSPSLSCTASRENGNVFIVILYKQQLTRNFYFHCYVVEVWGCTVALIVCYMCMQAVCKP